MTLSVIFNDAAALSSELGKRLAVGRVIGDERVVLVEPKQPVRGDGVTIFAFNPPKIFW